MATRTYSGSCHCGAVRFRVRGEEITTGIRCNCSICIRRGAVMSTVYYPPEAVEELVSSGQLEEVAAGHVREVRRLVVDVLTPGQLAALADAARAITDAAVAVAPAACREPGGG